MLELDVLVGVTLVEEGTESAGIEDPGSDP
jgi:hypothetical protein